MTAALAYDRLNGRLDGANLVEAGAALAMRLGAKASAPMGHRGFSLGCRMLGAVHGGREIVVRLNEDALFAFPFGDGYWSLLLDRQFEYEPELARFLARVSDLSYTFIDAGANFGLWSVIATSAPYGRQKAVAIEASSATAARARRNSALNGDRFKVLHRAVSATTGGEAVLSGTKHEARSIVGGGEGERVPLMALDSLIDEGHVGAEGPFVVKIDVEGVEIEAFRGAARLMAAGAVAICEEHGADRAHTVSRYLMDEAKAKLFILDPRSDIFVEIVDLAMLDKIKTDTAYGYNVFATTSALWQERLSAKPKTGM